MSQVADKAGNEGFDAGTAAAEQAGWPPSKSDIKHIAEAAATAAGTSICASYGLGPASPACGAIAGAAAGVVTELVLNTLDAIIDDPSFSPVIAETANVGAKYDAIEYAAAFALDKAIQVLVATRIQTCGNDGGFTPADWKQALSDIGVLLSPAPTFKPVFGPDIGSYIITQLIDPRTGVTQLYRDLVYAAQNSLPNWLITLQKATTLLSIRIVSECAAMVAEEKRKLFSQLKPGSIGVPVGFVPGPGPQGDLKRLLIEALS